MTWENILRKAHSPMLDKANPKKKKKIKKVLQSVQPSEYMGQDFTKLGDLLDELNSLDFKLVDRTVKGKYIHLKTEL